MTLTVTSNVCGADVPHVLDAETVILPPLVFAVVLIEAVDELPDQPPGRVQLYDVAPATGVTEYTLDVFSQMDGLPLIAMGEAGISATLTTIVWNTDAPQELLAVTVIFPLIVPTVAFMLFVVEEPVHPLGMFHVYEVALATETTLYVWAVPAQMAVFPEIAPGCVGTGLTLTANEDN
jgi:hypothetical protein